MVKTASGKAREDGAVSMKYLAGTQYEATEKWQEKVFSTLVSLGFANEIGGNAGPTETKRKRARDAKGKLKADDPSTPDVNEAWEEPTPPKKKRGRPPKVKK